jgi:DNA-binding CsgD family transcriptional regulator
MNEAHLPCHLVATLTEREREVLALLAEGLAIKEIAHRLAIAPGTARVHLMHVYEKLGVNKAMVAMRFAIRCGLIAA